MTNWTIAIDWDRDGDYADANSDVTNRVIAAKWTLGMDAPYQDIADEAKLTLVLENGDKLYSPDNTSGALYGKVQPFRKVRIQSNDGLGLLSSVRTHWIGWIETIQPEVGRYGKRTVQIVANGAMQFLRAAETNLPLQMGKRADQIVLALLNEVVIPPSLDKAWVLGRIGNSELTETTWLPDVTATYDVEPGTLTFNMVGDNWVRQGGLTDAPKDTYDVYHAMEEITVAERGRFFFDREGKAIFWNRHRFLNGATPALTLNDTMTDMKYTYAGVEQCKNEVVVICHPRTISSDNQQILWQLADAVIRLEADETRIIYVKYQEEGGKRIGGKDVTVGNVEFEVGQAAVTVKESANGAELTFKNTWSGATIIKKCVVRGRKITDAGQMEAKSQDLASKQDYGRRTLRLNLPSIDSLQQAQYIADFEKRRRAQPQGEVLSATVASHGKLGGGQHTEQLVRTIGDMITITETQTGHSKDYYIVGESHELTQGATLWKTTWYLERAPQPPLPWKLGDVNRSKLTTSAYVGY